MTLGLAVAFIVYGRLAALGPLANFSGMALVGFMLFGPDALLSATAAQDLGGDRGAGTAAGVINGVGSLGAIAQGSVTAWVAATYGWATLFTLFVWLSVLCSAMLVVYSFRERRV
jgi:sugar phosphate permease